MKSYCTDTTVKRKQAYVSKIKQNIWVDSIRYIRLVTRNLLMSPNIVTFGLPILVLTQDRIISKCLHTGNVPGFVPGRIPWHIPIVKITYLLTYHYVTLLAFGRVAASAAVIACWSSDTSISTFSWRSANNQKAFSALFSFSKRIICWIRDIIRLCGILTAGLRRCMRPRPGISGLVPRITPPHTHILPIPDHATVAGSARFRDYDTVGTVFVRFFPKKYDDDVCYFVHLQRMQTFNRWS